MNQTTKASKIRWNFNGQLTRLREGDFVKYDNQTVRVQRVTPTAAYVALPREARTFTTLMGQTVTVKPSARCVAISANSEIPIVRRAA